MYKFFKAYMLKKSQELTNIIQISCSSWDLIFTLWNHECTHTCYHFERMIICAKKFKFNVDEPLTNGVSVDFIIIAWLAQHF